SGSFSLGAGVSQSVSVKFSPGSEGYKTATLLADGTNCDDVSSVLSGTGIQPPDTLPGDADGNGTINVLDMTKVARIILGFDPETPGSDTDLNGTVNVLDMTLIARIILGL
ncbi:MAG: dockerin type I repeat-containing protein, partial [Dehalococcoidales bacterium]|nr:dockerin type I repeat-containing protein [Dehalococcoidales bacterium]